MAMTQEEIIRGCIEYAETGQSVMLHRVSYCLLPYKLGIDIRNLINISKDSYYSIPDPAAMISLLENYLARKK